MSESITRRVARLVSGSMNALVDAVENSAPETVMEQAIRELDSAIADTRAELGQLVAQKHLASKKLMEENSRHDALSSQLEVAVANGRDDLAEAGIAEQMDIEARIPVLEATISDNANREKELEGFVQALLAKKREMQAELRSFIQAQQATTSVANAAAKRGDTAADKAGRASDAFGRVLENASGLAGRDTNLGNSAKLAELDELARKNRVAERLAALKAGKS